MSKLTHAAMCLACAMVIGNRALAADPAPSSSASIYLDDTVPTSTSVLNEGMDKIGLGSMMKDLGIKAGGFIEGSYTYNFRDPSSDISEGRVFDFEHNVERMNQLALQLARTPDIAADAKAGKWDIGFGLDMMYGSDGRVIHANGLDGYNQFNHPINQFDLTQAYLDLIIPVGNGLEIRAGKFVSLLDYETISPIATVTGSTGNSLYSHSYAFGFGAPFTQTGVIASYMLNNKLTLTGGFTRGWDEATNDNNGAIDFLGRLKYALNDEWTFVLNSSIGPQMYKDNGDYRYAFTGFAEYKPRHSRWSFALDGTFAWEEHASLTGDTAYWYGLAGYASYTLCDYAQLNARAEWFRDDGGSRIGIDASIYEVTLGMKITPFPHNRIWSNLILRPEVRGDFSNKDAFNGGNDRTQGTLAMDAIFAL